MDVGKSQVKRLAFSLDGRGMEGVQITYQWFDLLTLKKYTFSAFVQNGASIFQMFASIKSSNSVQ